MTLYTFPRSSAYNSIYGGCVYPHERLSVMQLVSNPSIGNQLTPTPAHSLWYKSKVCVSSELVVQIKQKGDTGVKTRIQKTSSVVMYLRSAPFWAVAVCHTLQHTQAQCTTLQHTATQCDTLQHTATHSPIYCSTLQRTPAHCNTLQHMTCKVCQLLCILNLSCS